MDSYTPLLEKTRVPQPSLQKFAVISIFSKLRSAPDYLDPDSGPGRDAISQCLQSTSSAVVDQSVRELCRLVTDSKIDASRGFLELQSALEGSLPRYVDVFVKGLGFLARFEFQKSNGSWRVGSPENHPFVKVLSCRTEVQSELVRQVILFMAQNRHLWMVEVCQFLRPFLSYSILRIPFSDSLSSSFARQLISSITSLCCSLPNEAMPIFKLLMGCLKYFPCKNTEDLRNYNYLVECMVDAYTVVLRYFVETKLLIREAQLCSVELLEAILSLCTSLKWHPGGCEPFVELSKHLVVVQKDIGLQYIHELSSVILSLFTILIQSELEHEQLSILKLLLLILKWKSENEYMTDRTTCALSEELLFLFPVINLMSSPSKSVKGAATELLVILEMLSVKLLTASNSGCSLEVGFPSISKPGCIVFRLLRHLWFQDESSSSIFFLRLSSTSKFVDKVMHDEPRSWASQLREYSSWIVDRQKNSLPVSHTLQLFLTEMPLLLGAISGVMVMHQSSGSSYVDSLAAIGNMDPKIGVTLLLTILFFNNMFARNDIIRRDMLLKLLGMLPSLASHTMMVPLVVQTILPMLNKDSKLVLHATATRLLCQTWEINDRAFGSLQGLLLPKVFTEVTSERNICISKAASVRDICRKNPDRGVDLILSVSACIESTDPLVQALGFQSLSHLCEADVIDFYTAWDVIAKHVLDYSENPIFAHSICHLLRWGAMDAEAYAEASSSVLQILWHIGSLRNPCNELQWAKARASAIESLTQYELPHIERGIPDFKEKNSELLFSETNASVLCAMEGLQVKIITYEHITRRRLVKEKRVIRSKIEKLLDVVPQAIFSSGKSAARDLPGAALLCLSFTPKDMSNRGPSKGLRDVFVGYKNALVEMAASLQLSRNIFVALLSLQSWKSFMKRWMRAIILSLDAKAPPAVLDKTSKAAFDILKSLMQIAEDSIPRSAENVALAIGALCVVLPPSAHTVKSTASKFLLNWLFQYEHEHRQWSAAISLGLISSCLHVTDHKLKLQNITGLVEVLCGSKSTLVRGSCGVGLGFLSQDLLTRVDDTGFDSNLEKETYKMQEADLLGKIVSALILAICQLAQSSSAILQSLSSYFPPGKSHEYSDINADLSPENCEDLEEDIWGVAGLILGLGSSVGAIYRSGAHDAVLKIKDLIVSWVPHVNPLVQKSGSCSDKSEIVLAIGSCLALPVVVAFCQKVELMKDNEVDHLVNGYKDLISELNSIKSASSSLHQNLLMASCIGAGSLLACILNEGVHSVEVECVQCLLELFRKCYTNPYPPIVHLGGMLGVVNAIGANAGFLFDLHSVIAMQVGYGQKESPYITGPLLSHPICEPCMTSLMQEIFLVAQNSDDLQLQHFAAWAVSILRHSLWSKEFLNSDDSNQTEVAGSKTISQSISEDSVVMKLCLWLTHLNYSEQVKSGTMANVGTIVTVLRCLSQAPRLPTFEWGAIVRRCMKYEDQVAGFMLPDLALKKGDLRKECLQFSLAHANQFDPLLTFLDELSDLSRFRTLELNLRSCLLIHLSDLMKIFSVSRLEKLFDDMAYCFSLNSPDEVDNPGQKSLLRISCWKGLFQCLDETSVDSLEYISNIEKCMEVLFLSLPIIQSAAIKRVDQVDCVEEWYEAVRCLGKARRSWLLDFLQVSQEDLVPANVHFIEVLKKIQAKAKLVGNGSLPWSELGKLKAYILNSESQGMWDTLIEVVAALQHADGSVKRQWLVDAVEISCVSSYPTTALQFLGLLSGSCCKYMPLLILDRYTVLSDLPVTLSSLLSNPSWVIVAESVASYLWASTERIYNWSTGVAHGDEDDNEARTQAIDKSENDMADFLMRVTHDACVSLRNYLPLDKQLRLANMI